MTSKRDQITAYLRTRLRGAPDPEGMADEILAILFAIPERVEQVLPLARNGDPDTSHDAAAKVNVKDQVQIVVDFLTKHDRPSGWTWDELSNWIGKQTSWRRLSDARRLGLVDWVRDEDDKVVTRVSLHTDRFQRACRVVKS